MANDLDKFPWIIDTASPATIFDEKWRGSLRWVSESPSAGDSVVVKDSSGRRVWEAHANTTDEQYESNWDVGYPRFVDGLIVDTLDSGRLYIYVN